MERVRRGRPSTAWCEYMLAGLSSHRTATADGTRIRSQTTGPGNMLQPPSNLVDEAGAVFEFTGMVNASVKVYNVTGRLVSTLADATLGPGRYLLLGDNRTRAYDARYWGSLRRSDLLGPALLVLFSRDPESGRIRWNRIGRLVD